MWRLVEDKPEVIITSAYEEYALESYELKVCDYLLKPYRLDRFMQATQKALDNYKLKHSARKDDEPFLLVKSEKRLIQVLKDDIYYLESYGNYVKIWLESEFLLTPKTLSSFEKELEGNNFYRVHKSYVVNKTKIGFVEGNAVSLKNGIQLPISKNYKSGFLKDL